MLPPLGFSRLSTAGRSFEFLLIVNEHSVVFDGGDGVFRLLAIRAELRSLEINIVCLPG